MTFQATTKAILAMNGPVPNGASGPIPLSHLSRTHLPELCRRLGFTQGAEIGVWKAGFSRLLCQGAPQMHLFCVDPWASYDDWQDGKNVPGSNIEAAYTEACRTLNGQNATILRSYSLEAAAQVPDGSLDFVYLDGNHAREHVTADLDAWVPKVRAGGIVAGHDYRHRDHKPYIQVIAAVNDYTQAHGIDPWFTTAADATPSFLWVVR